MQEGFILELGHSNARKVSRWVSGAPVRSFWMGVSVSDKVQYDVKTYRCGKCGFLESYAGRGV